MSLLRRALLLVACWPVAASAAGPPACRVAGDRIHWIADYCMFRLETDDEIAAGECINKQISRKFKSDCVAKVHFKRALCRLAISSGHRKDSLARCAADPQFAGSTVRNGGVGGR